MHCNARVINADRGYDSERHRRALRNRGIEPVMAEHGTEHGSDLGKYRWVVERAHAWHVTLAVPPQFTSSEPCRHLCFFLSPVAP